MRNLYVLLSVLFLTSCQKDVYYKVQNNRKPLITDKDTIVFESNQGNVDSFKIHIVNDVSVSDKQFYTESISIYYDRLNFNIKSSPKDSLMCRGGNNYVIVYAIPCENHTSQIQAQFEPNGFNEVSNDTSLKIKTNIYSNVHKMTESKESTLLNNRLYDISTFYASDQYGIIRFDYRDGEYFEMIKN